MRVKCLAQQHNMNPARAQTHEVASWLVRSSLDQSVRLQARQEEIVAQNNYCKLTEIGLRYNLCFPDDGNDMAMTLSAIKNNTFLNYDTLNSKDISNLTCKNKIILIKSL